MFDPVHDADRRLPRRALRADGAIMPLPQFQFPASEPELPEDPTVEQLARTLERLPPTLERPRKPRPPSAATQELTADDILEAEALPLVTASRRPARPSANSTEEIDARDVLEVAELHTPSFEARSLTETPSVAPVALDAKGSSSEVLPAPPPRSPGPWVVGSVLAGGAVLIVAGLVGHARASLDSGPVARASQAVPRATATAAPKPSNPPKSSAVAVSDLPRVPPTTGTIRLAPSARVHRLFVDGAVQPHGQAEVRCGEHRVKVGSAGQPHTITVPCGDEVVVAR